MKRVYGHLIDRSTPAERSEVYRKSISGLSSRIFNCSRAAQAVCCIALCLVMGVGAAQGDLIKTDDTVIDTSTGLEWLNLRRTITLSPNQVLTQLGPGGQFAGFQYATRDQFVTLFTEVFGTPLLVHVNGGLDLSATENFANLFGPTSFSRGLFSNGLPQVAGFFDVGPRLATEIAFFYDPAPNGVLTGGSDTDSFPLDHRDPTGGSFLVRPVPEPSLSLLSGALLGLAAVILRRRRKSTAI